MLETRTLLSAVVDGAEFRVNTTTVGSQSMSPYGGGHRTAVAPSGQSIVVWDDVGDVGVSRDGDGTAVFAQLYDAAGSPIGTEFRVNTTTVGHQMNGVVGMDAAGNFIVSWTDTAVDGSDSAVMAQKYFANGRKNGGEFRVNTFTTGHQVSPAVAMAPNGAFVVTWASANQDGDSMGIYAQAYHQFGEPNGTEFRVNTYTTGLQTDSTVAIDAAGNFVVAWTSDAQDGSADGIFAQRYSFNLFPSGSEFRVNASTLSSQSQPAVAIDANGDFVVTWTGHGGNSNGFDIFGQRFAANGTSSGAEFRVNTNTLGVQSSSDVAMDPDGDYVVTWTNAPTQAALLLRSGAGETLTINGPGGNDRLKFVAKRNIPDAANDPISIRIGVDGNNSARSIVVSGKAITIWLATDGAGAVQSTETANAIRDAIRNDVSASALVNVHATEGTGSGVLAAASAANLTLSSAVDDNNDVVFTDARINAGASAKPIAIRFTQDVTGNSSFALSSVETVSEITITVQLATDASGQVTTTGTSLSTGIAANSAIASLVSVANAGSSMGTGILSATTGSAETLTGGSDSGIRMQAYRADGVTRGSEFIVSTYTSGTGLRSASSVAMDAEGDFVVVWTSNLQDGAGYGVYSQRFNETGVDEHDDASPLVTAITALGSPLVYGDRLLTGPSAITIEFSEPMATSGAGNAQNLGNYSLTRGGVSVTSEVSGLVLNGNTVTMSFTSPLPAGTYALSANATLTDVAGNALDGDLNGIPGGITLRYFEVAETSPVGSEFRVATSTVGDQYPSIVGTAIASDVSGNFVVTWYGLGTGESDYGVYAQRYNLRGVAQGSEFRVNSTTTNAQSYSVVAMDYDGDFVVVWQSNLQDGANYGIYGQRYTAAGVPQGSEFRVNSTTTGTQMFPVVSMGDGGEFVIAWTSTHEGSADVFAQRFASDGNTIGSEFRVNSTTTQSQTVTGIATDDSGNFVIVWESDQASVSDSNVYAQRFNQQGEAVGSEMLVNSITASSQVFPSVAMADGGAFVITWVDNSGADGDDRGVRAQRYSPLGLPQGTEFAVNSFTTGRQTTPKVAMDLNGDFVISWSSINQDGDNYGVYAQRYLASGTPLGSEFRVNTHTVSLQAQSHIAMDRDGDFVIGWKSLGQDGGSNGIYAQLYSGAGPRLQNVFAFDSAVPNNATVLDRPSSLTLTFNKELATSANNTGHYQLHRGATNVSALISSVTRNTTSVTLNLTAPLIPGTYTLTVEDTLTDSTGVPLDGDNNDFAGGDDTHTFRVADLTPIQSEFRVNTYTTGSQTGPYGARRIDMNRNGDFVATWHGANQDGSGDGIFAQRFSPSGVPLGGEFRVNSYTTGNQRVSTVAIDSDGDFVIAWESDAQDGSFGGIFAQRYAANGDPQGSEFRVNDTVLGWQASPAIDMDADGDFVVTWLSSGAPGGTTSAKRYNSVGTALGSEFTVSSSTTGVRSENSVAMNPDGQFVVVWFSTEVDGAGEGIVGQRYRADGSPVGSEFVINTYTTGSQADPAIALADSGEFVVVWLSLGQDGDSSGVYGQRFGTAGEPLGTEFRVNTTTAGTQSTPEVAVDATGNFAVVWTSNLQDGDESGAFAQRYHASGTPAGSEFRVNSYTTSHQSSPFVAMGAYGDMLVVWTSTGQDGDADGIYAQRYHYEHSLPYIAAIEDSRANNLVGLNQVMTYTVTFSEDIDHHSFTAADIVNPATASFTVGAITEPSPGVFSVVVTLTSPGVFIFRVQGDVRDVAGNSLPAVITDNDVILVDQRPPFITGITDDDPNNLNGLNQTVTYTVTFSEDLDFSGAFSSRFENAGTASFSVGFVTETSPGVLSVPVTITSTGTFRLRVLGNAPLVDLQGNALPGNVHDDDTLTTVTAPPYITAIDDDDTDDVFGPNHTVHYTVTFNKDIDLGTVQSGDFGGQGNATYVIGTVTEPSPGVLVVPVTFTGAGAFRFKVLSTADIRDPENNSLPAEVGDNNVLISDFVRPYVTAITDNDPYDDLIGLNQTILYTISFREDIDADSVTAIDFINAITMHVSTFTIGTITETSPTSGVFVVPVTVTSLGAFQLGLSNTAQVFDANGNEAWLPVNDDNVFVVDAIRPHVLAASMDDLDGQIRVGDTVNVTIAFSERIELASVLSTAFTNLGTAQFVFGTVSEPTPGNVRIPITVTTAGSVVLTIGSSSLLVDRQLNPVFGVNLGIILIARP